LGHIVNSKGICPDPKKVEVVQNWHVPKNVHEVRSFLGLANYFRKFISHYSEVAAPLTNLTKKSHVWAWTGKCQDAFEKLKHLPTEAPLLRTPIVWLRMLLILVWAEFCYMKDILYLMNLVN
jgi:hypothetical protein